MVAHDVRQGFLDRVCHEFFDVNFLEVTVFHEAFESRIQVSAAGSAFEQGETVSSDLYPVTFFLLCNAVQSRESVG